MRVIHFGILYIGFVLLIGCANMSASNYGEKRFIKAYADSSFEEFANYSLIIRGYDNSHDPIILAYFLNADTGICRFPYRIIINHNTGNIKAADRNFWDSSSTCPIDESLIKRLAVRFYRLGIVAIEFDRNKNVHVQIAFNEEKSELIRIPSSDTSIRGSKLWRHIQGAWYKRVETGERQ